MTAQEMAAELMETWEWKQNVQALVPLVPRKDSWERVRISMVPTRVSLQEFRRELDYHTPESLKRWTMDLVDDFIGRENPTAAVQILRYVLEYLISREKIEFEQDEFWQEMAGWLEEMDQGLIFNAGGEEKGTCLVWLDPENQRFYVDWQKA